LCYGMQMSVIEFARNVCKLEDANSEEANSTTPHPVVHIMPGQKELLAKKQYGGTIRLGGWPCKIKNGTKLASIYSTVMNDENIITERHRHRYEFNNEYREILEKNGLTIAGTSPDGSLVEAVEISNHPFFVGVQFHPEYISRPLNPHPLFIEFIKACKK
ncbi:MAG: gamma-glutamyl-gamma-aminobutyrate hydrolase family protein, partial [Candidatus Falkowbacteria bacterium]|nr:gamma-glutamyl-gamma-aminobutyrate hydrolase family protein [Candidatus Falkowbacteria bacterium]